MLFQHTASPDCNQHEIFKAKNNNKFLVFMIQKLLFKIHFKPVKTFLGSVKLVFLFLVLRKYKLT